MKESRLLAFVLLEGIDLGLCLNDRLLVPCGAKVLVERLKVVQKLLVETPKELDIAKDRERLLRRDDGLSFERHLEDLWDGGEECQRPSTSSSSSSRKRHEEKGEKDEEDTNIDDQTEITTVILLGGDELLEDEIEGL